MDQPGVALPSTDVISSGNPWRVRMPEENVMDNRS